MVRKHKYRWLLQKEKKPVFAQKSTLPNSSDSQILTVDDSCTIVGANPSIWVILRQRAEFGGLPTIRDEMPRGLRGHIDFFIQYVKYTTHDNIPSRSRGHPSLHICQSSWRSWLKTPLPSLLFCSFDIWKISHSPQVGRKSSFLKWWILTNQQIPNYHHLPLNSLTLYIVLAMNHNVSPTWTWVCWEKLVADVTSKSIKSSNSNLPLSPAVPAKVHIGPNFDEQQNEIGRTTEAATPRHLPIAYVASASAKLEVYSINSLIQSEAKAKEAQRTNPPCCYKGPRFSSIAGRLDIGGHHISHCHCRRIRQTKGATKRSMIQKANENSGIKMFFIGWAYMSLPATMYALTMFTVVWKLARKCVKLRPSWEKHIQQTIHIPRCDKAVRPLLLSQRSFSWASIHRLSLQDKLPHAGRDSDSHPHPTPLASLWWLGEW